jgi:hypothetical protein
VTTRTIDEIEQAFREMGLTETTWGGKQQLLPTETTPELESNKQIFIRIETTTTPLETQPSANLA